MRASFSVVSAVVLATFLFKASTSDDNCTIISLCAAMVVFCAWRRALISPRELARPGSVVEGVVAVAEGGGCVEGEGSEGWEAAACGERGSVCLVEGRGMG